MVKAYVLDSSGDSDEHSSKLLFKAWSSVSRKKLRDYLKNDTRGVKREFISSLIWLRKHFIFDYAETFSRLLSPVILKVNLSGIRYFPVGYVTSDSNILRQGLWSFNALKLHDGYGIYQCIDHRRVAIYYDIITNNFVVKTYPEKSNLFFDNHSEEDVVNNIGNNSPEYKEMEIKVKQREINNYRPLATRVFNAEKLDGDQIITFSLEGFSKRNNLKVLMTVTDEDIDRDIDIDSSLMKYPINYTLLVYSIIQTWLHVYSEYFGEKYLIKEKKPYVQCYYDDLIGMYTNTYIFN
jgi:hypothetical protein